MDNYKIKFTANADFQPRGLPWLTSDFSHVVHDQSKAILTAIYAVNSGLTNVAQVYNLNDGILIYETYQKSA